MRVDRSRLPEVGTPADVAFPHFSRRTLDGGLALRTAQRAGLPLVSMILVVPSGTARDPGARQGLTSLTAGLMDEGAGALDAIQLHEAFARLGTHIETDVGADATTFGCTLVARHFEAALALIGDLVARPRFEPSDFARERELRLSRLLQMREMPPAIADRTMLSAVYGAHAYGHGALGTEASVEAITRDEIAAHHRSAFGSAGATLIVCGDISDARVEYAAGEAFRAWHTGASAPAPEPVADPAGEIVIVHRPGAAQTELRVARLSTTRLTPDYHALVVLNLALGGQFVSRINSKLREEKGYTYGARTGFDLRKGQGMFICQTAVDRDATSDALNDIFVELAAAAGARPIEGDELDRARTSLARGYARGLETIDQIARQAAQMALYGLPDDHVDRFVPRVRALTGEDMRAAAARWVWPASYVAVAAGDADRIETPIRALGLAPVRRIEDIESILK
ncbi:MAG: insulinase family protein [Acidobacteriota bacterium]|nr:insulinase family protein [Acidobacteriota bacterium]